MTPRAPGIATTPEVARLIRTDVWNLNRWAAHGWLQVEQAPGSGNRLTWTPEAIQHAAIVAQLVHELGVTPARASRLATSAVSNTGRAWSVEMAGILLIGRMTWVPEPPPEDPES